jgi:hypothetical protein
MNDGAFSPDLPLGASERRAPRPAPALLESVGRIEPVRTRRPLLTLVFVVIATVAYPLYVLSQFPLRKDLPGLPQLWFMGVGLLWLAGFVLPLSLALLPGRGRVLPNEGWAGRAALSAAVLLTLAALFTIDAPGSTILPASTWDGFVRSWRGCFLFGLRIVIPAILLGTIALARVMLVGAARLGAAIGAAGGALSGLTLHALCPVGGALHVVTSHAGAVVAGAILGAVVFPLVRRMVSALSA